MRDIAIISKNKIEQEYFESKLDMKKYKKKKLTFKDCDDVCYLEFDNSLIEKGSEEYKEYCAGFCDIVDEPEETAWTKVKFPWDDFYESVGIEYHYSLDILKALLLPFVDEDWYIISNDGDIVPIKEFVFNYDRLD